MKRAVESFDLSSLWISHIHIRETHKNFVPQKLGMYSILKLMNIIK